MIGWLILAAVLFPALALGRWAERERCRAQTQARTEVTPVTPVAPARRGDAAPAARACAYAPGCTRTRSSRFAAVASCAGMRSAREISTTWGAIARTPSSASIRW